VLEISFFYPSVRVGQYPDYGIVMVAIHIDDYLAIGSDIELMRCLKDLKNIVGFKVGIDPKDYLICRIYIKTI
jgi:hypothetical protein